MRFHATSATLRRLSESCSVGWHCLQPSTPGVQTEEIQVGFPGGRAEPTYVGSWQWDVHGEDAIKRAAAATKAAIDISRRQR
jgi:hypothetical protein